MLWKINFSLNIPFGKLNKKNIYIFFSFRWIFLTLHESANDLVDSRPSPWPSPQSHDPLFFFHRFPFPITRYNWCFSSEPLNHAFAVYASKVIIAVACYFIGALTSQNQFWSNEAAHPCASSVLLFQFFLDDTVWRLYHSYTHQHEVTCNIAATRGSKTKLPHVVLFWISAHRKWLSGK